MTEKMSDLCTRYYSPDFKSLQKVCKVYSPMSDSLDSATDRLLIADIGYCISGMKARFAKVARVGEFKLGVTGRSDLLPEEVSVGVDLGVAHVEATWEL